MTCPYMKSTGDIPDSPNILNGTNSMEKLTVSNGCPQSATEEDNPKEQLNYTTYINTEPLLNALKCLSHVDPSEESSPPVHDEHFFILIHQGNTSTRSNPNNI